VLLSADVAVVFIVDCTTPGGRAGGRRAALDQGRHSRRHELETAGDRQVCRSTARESMPLIVVATGRLMA